MFRTYRNSEKTCLIINVISEDLIKVLDTNNVENYY